MRVIAEANGGKLLSLEWKGNGDNYHFSFKDGREFWTSKRQLVSCGWPKDPDIFLRLSSNNPGKGNIYIEEMQQIAFARGGELLSNEWIGNRGKYWFKDQAGIQFQITYEHLKIGGWSPNAGLISEPVCRQAMQHLFGTEFHSTRQIVKREGKASLELDGYAESIPYQHGSISVAFEYQGDRRHRSCSDVIARDQEKKAFCNNPKNNIILVEIEPFREKDSWESCYVLSHVKEAVCKAFLARGLAIPNLNSGEFKVDMTVIHKCVESLNKLKKIAEDNGGRLLSSEWGGSKIKYYFR